MSRALVSLGLLFLLFASAVLAGDSWPQWRGPNRDGISTEKGLLPNWDAPPELLWKAEGLGIGYSGVSLGSILCTMGEPGEKTELIALNPKDGTPLWKANVGEGWKRSGYPGPRCTPTIDDDRVYAIGPHGDLVCVETATGKLLWSRNFVEDFGGKMMSGWGFSESPLVDGEKLICTPGGAEAGLVALDKRTGKELWRSELSFEGEEGRDGAGYSSIVISNAAGIKQYVQLVGRGLVGVDAESGKQLWSYSRIANGSANIPTPIVRDDYVFASNGYRAGSVLLKMVKSDEGIEAEEVYFLEGNVLQNHLGGMVLVGDYVYGGNGHNNGFPICIELLTGEVEWKQGRGPGTGSAAVTYADGNLYFRYQNGVMALIGATPDDYQLKGKFEVPSVSGQSWAPPTISDGLLYLREQDKVYCYQLKQ